MACRSAQGRPAQRHHPPDTHPARAEYGWLTSRWEDIKPEAEGRPRRRYYRLTEDGAERARIALAQAATSVSTIGLRARPPAAWHERWDSALRP